MSWTDPEKEKPTTGESVLVRLKHGALTVASWDKDRGLWMEMFDQETIGAYFLPMRDGECRGWKHFPGKTRGGNVH